jgi:hypothetical protein
MRSAARSVGVSPISPGFAKAHTSLPPVNAYSLDCLLKLLFERRGARLETSAEVIYWVNATGLSLSYRRLLAELVEGLCAMDLRDQGKPIRVCLKDMPP